MNGSAAELHAELERLRAEHRQLDAQVKLLVLAEQRQSRSQNELDVQLLRLRALARFSLDCTSVESPDDVLARALRLLAEGFAVDCVAALRCEPDGTLRRLHTHESDTAGAAVRIDPADWQWLQTLEEPVYVSGPAAQASAARRCADAVLQHPGLTPDNEQQCLALVPLRHVDAHHRGAIVLAAVRPRPVPLRDGGLHEQHLPFLQLLGHHVERAISTALLTDRLRERSDQLSRSIESLERAQQALVEAQKMEGIGRLAGGIAHDFNNLLTVILGYGEELAATLPPGSTAHDSARGIVAAGRRAAAITGQLLAFSRRQRRNAVPLDLGKATRSTIEVLQRLVGPRIDVALAFDDALPAVEMDPAQLEQILLNLVVNARDAMPEGGHLQLRTRPANVADAARCAGAVDPTLFAVLEVADTGIGMDEATRAQIFEPFFSTKGGARSSGLGLGLAVVYGIVQQSHGHILVSSAPGAGTTFSVLLPFAAASSRAAAPAAATGDRPHPPRLLVVEDEAQVRAIVATTLRRAGYTVHEADSAEAALRLFDDPGFVPAMVLTDVTLPGLDGVRLAEALVRQRQGLRIAFMTGYSQELITERLDWRSALLSKPFTVGELLQFVQHHLHRETATSDA